MFILVTCDSDKPTGVALQVAWKLQRTTCSADEETTNSTVTGSVAANCQHGGAIILNENGNKNSAGFGKQGPIAETQQDGIYTFIFSLDSQDAFRANAHVEMLGTYGYLSAADWPLLPFYGSMCIVYVGLGVIWLTVSFMQWRDLLRIQFWIGGVILLGMMEKAMFYSEYQSINSGGVPKQAVVLFAEWVSCAKRTLARMLVIIVSLGFGIVK